MAEALLIDDDASFQAALAELVRAEGFSVDTAASLGEARAFLGEHTPDLALVDLNLPHGSGLELLREIDSSVPTEIVLITGHATVLVQGDSGTRKELVAQTLHQLSRRRKEPFVALNCAAVSPQLIESELFGHERGSFTGAARTHKGYFERAEGGTLFLDEISEMPIELQVRLLRVLETGTVARVGGESELKVDVRVVAATNREPEHAVAGGKLREDLLYRLSVFPIRLPALRERTGDVELLVRAFLAELNGAQGTRKGISRAALELLRGRRW